MNTIPFPFKPALLALFALFFCQNMEAQGWRSSFEIDSFNQVDDARTLLPMLDGGFLLAGSKYVRTNAEGDFLWMKGQPNDSVTFASGNNIAVALPDGGFAITAQSAGDSVYLYRYDAGGEVLWNRAYATPGYSDAFGSVISTQDGGFALMANLFNNGYVGLHILKTTSDGSLQWIKKVADSKYGASFVQLSDGSFAIAGYYLPGTFQQAFIAKTDLDGELEWAVEYNMPVLSLARSVIESPDHHVVVVGSHFSSMASSEGKAFVKKLDFNGNEVWSSWSDLFAGGIMTRDIIATSDGQYAVCGELVVNNGFQGFLWKIDGDGQENWMHVFDQDNTYEHLACLVQTADGGFALAGDVYDQATYFKMLLLKTDALGYDYSHHLVGKLFRDDDLACDLDSGEAGLNNWLVTAVGNGENFFGTTDDDGHFDILVDTGMYELTVVPYFYWENCQPSYTVEAFSFYDSSSVDIPLQPSVLCPYMEVDIASTIHELCNEGSYVVSYCNYGTIDAPGATVQVTLDDSLTYLGASAPLLSQAGQVLLFDLGTVPQGDCGSFTLDFMVSCDLSIFDQTLSSEAHIFPDSICIDDFWLGPNIRVEGQCEGGDALFRIINEGGDMTDPLNYIVIEDNLIMMTNEFQLPSGGETNVPLVATPGETYHLIALQVPGFPGALGYPVASASIEACAGNVNPGAFGQIQQDDGEPWLDIASQPVADGYPANYLSAQPSGWQEDHFIQPETQLEYLVNFQNLGSDTALQVVIIDTLSSFLDPTSLLPGASSHPYTFELDGLGVAKFTFDNILLSDSLGDDSQGWLQFRIAQKAGNPTGTVIHNTAAIYLGFNVPMPTNTTFHTIGQPWAELVNESVESFVPKLKANVAPNPMGDWAVFEVENLMPGENTLVLTDLTGRQLLRQPFVQDKSIVQRGRLVAGVYFFKVENSGRVLATGKLVLH